MQAAEQPQHTISHAWRDSIQWQYSSRCIVMALTLCRKAPPSPCVVVAPTKRHAADSMQYVILHIHTRLSPTEVCVLLNWAANMAAQKGAALGLAAGQILSCHKQRDAHHCPQRPHANNRAGCYVW